jgi:DNA-binding beta-propeller fold protein YncE
LSTPSLTQVINADGRPDVVGVTSVDNRLYVLRRPSQQSIDVYDLQTFTLQPHKLKVNSLSDHWYNGLTACVVNKCIYVCDYVNDTVYKVQLTVDNKISKWSVGRAPCGLSINTACNFLVACYDDKKIQEYTASGSLVRDISIKSNDGKFLSPFHVIQLTSGQFVVSCDVNSLGVSDVVELDTNGQVLVSYRNQLQSTTHQSFSYPCHLAVAKNNEFILVADHWNNRIVILSRSLNCCAHEFNVMSVDGELQNPSCLHFNESQGRLFVGEDSGRVSIFDNVIDIANSFQ